jgi:hemerythrin-like domain-containing protein
MKELLDRNIKDIIYEYPDLEALLAEFSIGCTSCSLGSCRLKDIVEIHNLSPESEQRLMRRIAEVVYPGMAVEIPILARKPQTQPGEARLCPPLRQLVDEHSLIKRVLRLIPPMIDRIEGPRSKLRGILPSLWNQKYSYSLANPEASFGESARCGIDTVEGTQMALECIDFVREYADEFHHAKEENILFGYFDETSEIMSSFCKEHEMGRLHVRDAAAGIKSQNLIAAKEHFLAYAALLAEHIRKEDDILYPWMNRTLSDNQVGRLFSDFLTVNARYAEKSKKYAALVARLEETITIAQESHLVS